MVEALAAVNPTRETQTTSLSHDLVSLMESTHSQMDKLQIAPAGPVATRDVEELNEFDLVIHEAATEVLEEAVMRNSIITAAELFNQLMNLLLDKVYGDKLGREQKREIISLATDKLSTSQKWQAAWNLIGVAGGGASILGGLTLALGGDTLQGISDGLKGLSNIGQPASQLMTSWWGSYVTQDQYGQERTKTARQEGEESRQGTEQIAQRLAQSLERFMQTLAAAQSLQQG